MSAIPLAVACHEASTGPSPDALAPPGAPTRDASPGTAQGPVHIPIAETNAVGWGTLPWTGTGMTVPSWTSYIVKVSGRTTVSPNPDVLQCKPDASPPYGAEGSYGPSGDRYYQLRVEPGLITSAGVGSVGLRYDGVGTTGSDNAQSDTAFAWDGGEIAMRRSGIQGSTNGSTGCVVWLYSLASAQTISLVTLDGQELSVAPSRAAVKKGTVVSFRATSRGVLVNAPHWRFDAAPGAVNETTACGTSGPNPCAVTVQNSGTLRVASNVQGRMRAASAQVTVYSSFALDADRTTIVAGDTVTFTPKLDGTTGKAARWLWRGDDSLVVAAPCAPDTDKCVQTPYTPGTMWAFTAATGGDSASTHVAVEPPKLTLTALPTSLAAGDNSTFTVTANGAPLIVQGWAFRVDSGGGPGAIVGSPWGDCLPGMTQCTNAITASGTVIVLGTVRGISSKDSVHISATAACSSPNRIASSGGFSIKRSSDCMPGGDELPQPGGDIGPEDGTDCSSLDFLMISYLPPPAAKPALLSNRERIGGPSPVEEDPEIICAFDTCTRDATVAESEALFQKAVESGEWRYTQGGAQGGQEPAKNIPAHYGDCTDYTWNATMAALGPTWPHGWNQKINTRMFDTLSVAALARVGYREVPADSARPGDIVVRGGHAGVFGLVGGSHVWGFANNGKPAYSTSQPNVDSYTGWYNFSTVVTAKGETFAPKFFRPLVVIPCP